MDCTTCTTTPARPDRPHTFFAHEQDACPGCAAPIEAREGHSFLDVVANVIGIIIRLILVAWVGARSYTAAMQFVDEEPPPAATMQSARAAAPPKPSTTPNSSRGDR